VRSSAPCLCAALMIAEVNLRGWPRIFCTTRRLPVLRSVRIPVVFDDYRFPSGDEAPGDLWSEKSFANVSEVAGNSRIKM
jgi:hypothetical protein